MLSVLIGKQVGMVDLTDVSRFHGTFESNQGQLVKFVSPEFGGKVGAKVEGVITLGDERAFLRGVVLEHVDTEVSIWATELEMHSLVEREPRFRATHVRAAILFEGKLHPVVLDNASRGGAGISTPHHLPIDENVILAIWSESGEIQVNFRICWFGRGLQEATASYGLSLIDPNDIAVGHWQAFVAKLH